MATPFQLGVTSFSHALFVPADCAAGIAIKTAGTTSIAASNIVKSSFLLDQLLIFQSLTSNCERNKPTTNIKTSPF